MLTYIILSYIFIACMFIAFIKAEFEYAPLLLNNTDQ